MSTPNNDSPATQPWAEAAAREISDAIFAVVGPQLLERNTAEFLDGLRRADEKTYAAIILKFAPPDLSAEVARLQKAKIDACIAWTEVCDRLRAAQAENEKLRDEVAKLIEVDFKNAALIDKLQEERHQLKQDVSREISVCDTACMDAAALRVRLAQLTAAKAENEKLVKDAIRLHWLHDCSNGVTDLEGYEWGIYRVKWVNGRAVEVLATLSDFSDLDDAMKAELTGQPTLRALLPTTPPTEGKE